MVLWGTDSGVCWELPCSQVSRATGDALGELAWPLAAGIRASQVVQDASIHATPGSLLAVVRAQVLNTHGHICM